MKSIFAMALSVLLLAPFSATADTSWMEPAYDEFESSLETLFPLDSPEKEIQFSSNYDDIYRAKIVAIINKSTIGSTTQLMRVYVDGELKFEWKVSTGREKVEKAKSGRVYKTTTPVGYYRPTKLVKNYHSNTWKAEMPNSVFFNGGIAVHASTHIEQLGQRASGGCIRLSPNHAATFFKLVSSMQLEEVNIINRISGKNSLNSKGEPMKIINRDVLIIVENKI
jgi:hypothetical protein